MATEASLRDALDKIFKGTTTKIEKIVDMRRVQAPFNCQVFMGAYEFH